MAERSITYYRSLDNDDNDRWKNFSFNNIQMSKTSAKQREKAVREWMEWLRKQKIKK